MPNRSEPANQESLRVAEAGDIICLGTQSRGASDPAQQDILVTRRLVVEPDTDTDIEHGDERALAFDVSRRRRVDVAQDTDARGETRKLVVHVMVEELPIEQADCQRTAPIVGTRFFLWLVAGYEISSGLI